VSKAQESTPSAALQQQGPVQTASFSQRVNRVRQSWAPAASPQHQLPQQMKSQQSSRRRSTMSFVDGISPEAGFHDDDVLDDAVVAATSREVVQPEPDPDVGNEGPLSVSTRVEYSALPRGLTRDVFGLVTVQAVAPGAPELGPGMAGKADQRQPMDLICVLDVSGSMTGDKLRQVQEGMRFIIGQADPKDRVSIVAFNSEAGRVLRLTRMSVEGKDSANVATLRLSAGGGTSIAAGLEMALSVMEQRRQRNKVSAILLLTDGQDGSTRRRLPELLLRAARANCALYAFGFGSDHDAALLSEIAEQAQTPFTYVEDTERVGEAFAGAVGGLTSVVAQKVELTLKGRVPLKTIHTPFPLQRISDTEATVTIPDIFAGERRDILVELSVPAEGAGAEQKVLLEAFAQYTDLKRNLPVRTSPAVMEAQIVEEPQPEAEPDEEVSAQRQRVEVTRTLNEAAAASDLGQFEDARRMLDGAEQRMVSAKKKSSVTEAMTREVQDARSRMQSRSVWEQSGRAEVKDAMQMHAVQRCTNTTSSKSRGHGVMKMSKAMYSTPIQDEWIERNKASKSLFG